MAAGKKTFIFYSDWSNMIQEMPDTEAGMLLKHILSYVNDENPESPNILVKMAFAHIKPLLKEDLKKWDDIRKIRKIAGSNGGKANGKQNEANGKQNEAVNVNVNDNVNVNVNVNKLNTPVVFEKEFISNDFEPYEVVGEESNQTTEKKQKEKPGAQKEKEPTAEIRPTFDEFWNEYDKKVGREQTVKIWSTMPHSEKQLAFDQIQHYKSSQPDKKYRKDPERYLKLKAYNNEIISNNDTANNSNNSFGQLPIGSRIANTLSMDSLAKSVARNMQRFAPQPEPTSGD